MTSLEIKTDYLEALMSKVRSVMGRTSPAIPDPGSNPTDEDAGASEFEERSGDLRDDEVSAEIRGLNDRQQLELIALLWLGRGDAEPDEWEDLIERARREIALPADEYLLGHPLLAEHWAEGLSLLGIEGSSSTTELQQQT